MQPDRLRNAPCYLARTRSRTECRSLGAVKRKLRCRMHGGTNPGAPKGNRNAWKHAGRSADPEEAAHYLWGGCTSSIRKGVLTRRKRRKLERSTSTNVCNRASGVSAICAFLYSSVCLPAQYQLPRPKPGWFAKGCAGNGSPAGTSS